MTEPDAQTTSEFEALIERFQKGIWRLLRLMGCTREEADDITQETFVAAWRAGMRDIGDAPAFAYLRTTARNKLIELRRKQARLPDNAEIEAAESVWSRVAPDDSGEEQLAALRECMSNLTARAREALRLAYGAGQGREAIAQTLSVSEHGVRNLLARTRAALRECIERRVQP